MMSYQEEDSLTEPRLSVKQAAEYMGVTDAAVYIAKKKGTLRPENVNGDWLFSIQQLDAYKSGNHPPPYPPSDDMGQNGGDVLVSHRMQPRDELLDSAQAAAYLHTSVQMIHNLRSSKELVGQKDGNHLSFTSTELDDYLARKGEKPQRRISHTPLQVESQPREPDGRFAPKTAPTTTRYAVEREPEVTADSEKMPVCRRCSRQFISTREYTIKKFIEAEGEPAWYPVCRDGRCDPTVQNARLAYQEQLALKREQKRSSKLIAGLKAIRAEIDRLIAENEETSGKEA